MTENLTPSAKDRLHVWIMLLVGLIVILTITGAALVVRATGNNGRHELREYSETVAAALGPDKINQLEGDPSDATTQAYEDLKAQLAAAKRPHDTWRSIYIAGEHDGRVFFYVDSEQPGDEDYSAAAEWYDEATEVFKGVFVTNRPAVEGPASDVFGTFISGFAPIYDPMTAEVVAVVGIDVAASTYWRDIAVAAALPLAVGMLLITTILVFEGMRRRNQRLLILRSQLVSVVSHELNSPLTGIRWAAESLRPLVADSKALPLVESIYKTSANLQTSTNDILQLSQTVSGHRPALEPTDVAELIREAIETQALSAERKGVQLVVTDALPQHLVLNCNASEIKRALHNVLSNAIKYTRDNTSVSIDYHTDEHAYHISVADQGIGIPANEQAKIFDGFYRASNAKDIQGTGLGLFLVKAVMERHGGSVSLSSEPDKGSTFTLSFPKH